MGASNFTGLGRPPKSCNEASASLTDSSQLLWPIFPYGSKIEPLIPFVQSQSDFRGALPLLFGKFVEKLVQGDWVVPDSGTGGIVDRIRDGSADSADSEFTDALRFHRR